MFSKYRPRHYQQIVDYSEKTFQGANTLAYFASHLRRRKKFFNTWHLFSFVLLAVAAAAALRHPPEHVLKPDGRRHLLQRVLLRRRRQTRWRGTGFSGKFDAKIWIKPEPVELVRNLSWFSQNLWQSLMLCERMSRSQIRRGISELPKSWLTVCWYILFYWFVSLKTLRCWFNQWSFLPTPFSLSTNVIFPSPLTRSLFLSPSYLLYPPVCFTCLQFT